MKLKLIGLVGASLLLNSTLLVAAENMQLAKGFFHKLEDKIENVFDKDDKHDDSWCERHPKKCKKRMKEESRDDRHHRHDRERHHRHHH